MAKSCFPPEFDLLCVTLRDERPTSEPPSAALCVKVLSAFTATGIASLKIRLPPSHKATADKRDDNSGWIPGQRFRNARNDGGGSYYVDT